MCYADLNRFYYKLRHLALSVKGSPLDARICRLKAVPALKALQMYNNNIGIQTSKRLFLSIKCMFCEMFILHFIYAIIMIIPCHIMLFIL